MLFNSFQYLLLFLPCVLLLTLFARRALGARAAQVIVLISSLSFYAWWKPSNLPFLAGSILANWLIAHAMANAAQAHRKTILKLGLVLNIGYLCVFKYLDFLLTNLPFTGNLRLHLPDLAFPLGISFFTLVQIMYLIDCYEGLLPVMGLFDHATFVSFFPYVISGPIAKAKRMLHQFDHFGGGQDAYHELFARGLYLFAIGLFKKVIFADAFASLANVGFAAPGSLSTVEAWIFSISYTLQIYFDFSGYSDMAIGSALMLGIEIPRNFDAPLRSKSIIEFFQRWHISLTNFITTYLYTPILKSFSRVTLFTSAVATVLAMAIAGLWHGPAWTFVFFGVLYGTGLAVNQYWRKKKMPKLPAFPSWLITFLFVNFAFIFFRSHDLHEAAQIARSLVGLRHPLSLHNLKTVNDSSTSLTRLSLPILIGSLLAFFGKSSDQMAREFRPTYANSIAIAAMIVACWISMAFTTGQEFIYFKF